MSQVPLHNHNVSSLEEDLRVLNLLPDSVMSLSESRSNVSKKSTKKDYDYEDEMEDEDVEENDVEENDVEENDSFDFENGPAEIEEAARSVVDAFNSLSEDEVDELDDSYVEAVRNAAEVLGLDLGLEEDEDLDEDEEIDEGSDNKNWRQRNLRAKKRRGKRKNTKRSKAAKIALRGTTDAEWKARGKKAAKTRKRHGTTKTSDVNGLDNIIERLRGLTTPLAQESNEVGTISDKICEGLKSLHANALRVSTTIAEELAEDDFDKSDPRYGLGVWFEGICDDAEGLLDRIFEHGDVPMEDAIEDLQALTSDFKKGLAKANRIA